MEICFRNLSLVDLPSLGNVLGSPELRSREQGPIQLIPSGPTEVLCPKPSRPSGACLACEDMNGSSCKSPRSCWPWLRNDPTCDFLSLLTPRDEMEDVLCCSPPARTDNPLIHNVLFINRTSDIRSWVENGESTEKPIVRKEGFPCGDS